MEPGNYVRKLDTGVGICNPRIPMVSLEAEMKGRNLFCKLSSAVHIHSVNLYVHATCESTQIHTNTERKGGKKESELTGDPFAGTKNLL